MSISYEVSQEQVMLNIKQIAAVCDIFKKLQGQLFYRHVNHFRDQTCGKLEEFSLEQFETNSLKSNH